MSVLLELLQHGAALSHPLNREYGPHEESVKLLTQSVTVAAQDGEQP